MKRFSTIGLYLLPLALICVACSDAPTPTAVRPVASDVPVQTLLAEGASLYGQTCATCHLDGKGSDLVPPLVGAPAVASSDPSALVKIILQGQMGEIERGGRKFNGIMPGMAYLTDREVAAVSTYVRQTYGSPHPPVQPGQVRPLR